MKTKKFGLKELLSWISFCIVGVALLLSIFILQPHRLQTIETHAILQNGMKMEAQFTLQSSWGWNIPDRLIAMNVSIDGKNVPVARKAYYGLRPIDLNRRPIIAETGGFPEIVMNGTPQSSLTNVHWHFLNYSFSELDVFRNHREDISYYSAPPPPLGQIRITQYDAPVPVIMIGKESIKKISAKDLTK